jgi:hypothetical protein
VRVKIVVMLEPGGQLSDDGFSIRGWIDRDVVALEGFDERL